jgi:hypothetical protein
MRTVTRTVTRTVISGVHGASTTRTEWYYSGTRPYDRTWSVTHYGTYTSYSLLYFAP